MVFRRVLVPLTGGLTDTPALAAAFAFAKTHKAHVDACFVWPNPEDLIPYLGLGENEGLGVDPQTVVRLVEEADRSGKHSASLARQEFEKILRQYDVKEVQEPRGPGASTARWCEIVGRPDSEILTLSRVSDITVIAGNLVDYDRPAPGLPERTLLESGRPLLFAPGRGIIREQRSVAIAWDGSMQAARAVVAAHQLLLEAERVEILSIRETPESRVGPDDLVEYLAWHGLESHGSAVPANGETVAEALLNLVQEKAADLLVMGGYAHSRFREIFFGGTTRHVLRHAIQPVLLTH